jgi:hypothetical protein
VREVGVHLQDAGRPAVQRDVEAREVRRAEPLALGAVQHLHRLVALGERVGEPPGPVG